MESKYDVNQSSNSLGEAFHRNIRPIIDTIDKLRSIGLQQDINLPNVVVVGDQSSGKSSIIEAISGIQLPRGKGIVTRCPLELQLKRVNGEPWKATIQYKTFSGPFENIKISKPSDVETGIKEAQEKLCGSNKDVSSEIITLRIESPDESAPDLTLIDLPGIARIAVGKQSYNICDKIRAIIMNHIVNENTVILCIVSANLDPAVNESIKMAKEVDPGGKRTLGVITKSDLVEKSNKEDVLSLLNNEKVKLVKGFHMVKCRSQKELDEGLELEESIKNESTFFEKDEVYSNANKNRLGIFNLASKITKELVSVIQENLPNLKETLCSTLDESRKKLNALPDPVPDDKDGRRIFLNKIINNIKKETESALLEGKSSFSSYNHFYIWRNFFREMRESISNLNEEETNNKFSLSNLNKEISLNRGKAISGFLDYETFETLVSSHIFQYKPFAEDLLEKMKKETEKIIFVIVSEYCKSISQVQIKFKNILSEQLKSLNTKAFQRINDIFEQEKLVYTSDEAFDKEMGILLTSKQPLCNNALQYDRSFNTERLLDAIKCYLKIASLRLNDTIPMSIRQSLHVELCQALSNEFNTYLFTGDLSDIVEDDAIHDERKYLEDKIKRLEDGRKELDNNLFSVN